MSYRNYTYSRSAKAGIFIATFLSNLIVPAQLTADPTRPIGMSSSKSVVKVQKKSVKQPLKAIFYRNKRYFAIIEGKTYRRGDIYRGSRITRISESQVTLKNSKGSYRLNLANSVKKLSKPKG